METVRGGGRRPSGRWSRTRCRPGFLSYLLASAIWGPTAPTTLDVPLKPTRSSVERLLTADQAFHRGSHSIRRGVLLDSRLLARPPWQPPCPWPGQWVAGHPNGRDPVRGLAIGSPATPGGRGRPCPRPPLAQGQPLGDPVRGRGLVSRGGPVLGLFLTLCGTVWLAGASQPTPGEEAKIDGRRARPICWQVTLSSAARSPPAPSSAAPDGR